MVKSRERSWGGGGVLGLKTVNANIQITFVDYFVLGIFYFGVVFYDPQK